jgi:exodeoxyribonuclease-5
MTNKLEMVYNKEDKTSLGFLDDEKVLYEDQQRAMDELKSFLEGGNNVHVLSGYAGTGKTFTVDLFGEMCNELGFNVYYTASTNKAAKVMAEMTGKGASTIHSLMKLTVKSDYNSGKEVLVSNTKGRGVEIINPAVIVVDEASMVNMELLAHITKHNVKLLFVGDPKQLPPVGETVSPAFNLDYPMSTLDIIKRQALGNPIISLATKFREGMDTGEVPHISSLFSDADTKQGVRVIDRAGFNTLIERAFTSERYKEVGINFARVIAWRNITVMGYNNLVRKAIGYGGDPTVGEVYVANTAIINTDSFDNELILPNESPITITSVLPQTMYNIDCYLITCEECDESIFMVKDMLQYKQVLDAVAVEAKAFGSAGKDSLKKAKWREFFAIKKTLNDIRPQYAVTAHKSQGSTYDIVFIDYGDIAMNQKFSEMMRLMYVALTRAKVQAIITWG